MIDKVINTIYENNMFIKGDKVIVAVSGGPDSMCLLNILYRLKDELGISLAVAHVNHGLRGEEADEDEAYVKKFCDSIKVEYYSIKIDIYKISKEKGISCESAGRESRYEFFEDVRKKINAQKIALAHNANDQAETVLMRIIRGTGLDGLIGIKPVRDGKFVRPLINSTRDEIEEYCRVNDISCRIDKTNFENIYTRNKIRLELLPYIKENFNKDIIGTLIRLSNIIEKDNEFIEQVSEEKYKKYCENNSEKVIIYSRAFREPEAIVTRIIRRAYNDLKGNLYDLEKIHIYDIINIQKNSTGKKIMLKGGIEASNNYGDIQIYKFKAQDSTNIKKQYNLELGTNEALEFSLKVSLRKIDKEEKVSLKNNNLIKFFDYDKIKNNILLRYRREGDRFNPFGMKGSKKLKDIFIDMKIPKEERDKIPLVCFGDEIAWIVGYKVSDRFKVDKETKNILEIKFEGEENI